MSNSCIDRDIQRHAIEALKSGKKTLIRYSDLKLPCGGALEVLIDPTPDRAAIFAAKQRFDAGHPVMLSFQAPDTPASISFTYTPHFRLCLAGRGAIFRSVVQAGRATGFKVCLLSPDDGDLAAVSHLTSQPSVHLSM